jgi:hypothetical protein
MSPKTSEETQDRKLSHAEIGPGDQTVAVLWSPGSAYLDYYSQNGSTTLNVAFIASGQATATVQVDFGPQQPLAQGSQQFTFSQALQLFVTNQSGTVKYGWTVVS